MKTYPVRAEIYRPNVILGVRDSDWKWVGIISIALMTVPVIFEWFIWKIPASVFTTALGLGGSIAFFNWIRLGRRPMWLELIIKARMQGTTHARLRPADRLQAESYLIPASGEAAVAANAPPRNRSLSQKEN